MEYGCGFDRSQLYIDEAPPIGASRARLARDGSCDRGVGAKIESTPSVWRSLIFHAS